MRFITATLALAILGLTGATDMNKPKYVEQPIVDACTNTCSAEEVSFFKCIDQRIHECIALEHLEPQHCWTVTVPKEM